MDIRLSFLTLGVRDLVRARKFYEDGLAWRPIKALDDVIFYQGAGFVFALFPRDLLAADAGLADDGKGFSGISLAINHPTPAEVDATLAEAKAAGAAILKPAQNAFWGGYHGYFADPDGYAWEVAYNPAIVIGEEGHTTWKR
jgi:uncharacterized protein